MSDSPSPSPSSIRPIRPTRAVPAAPSVGPAPAETEESPKEQTDDELESLTAIRAHYLKKTLISLQFQNEISFLNNPPPGLSTLSYLGPPFKPPPKHAPFADLPFTRFIFQQFVVTFPFLAAAPDDFFPAKLQPFLASLLARNLSFTDNPLRVEDEETEEHAREKLLQRLQKNFSFLLGSATKLVEKEEVVRLSQQDLQRLEALVKRRRARRMHDRDAFEVNVIGVRTVTEKSRMRSRIHEEFIIRTRRARHQDIYVSRRHGDFKTLADELRKAHPAELIRLPPPKDRSSSSVSSTTSTSVGKSSSITTSSDSISSPTSSQRAFFNPAKLLREKNRLTLRSYLHSLMTNPIIASSPVLRSFLTASAMRPSPDEMEDIRRREEADRIRDEGRKKFTDEIASRIQTLRDALKHVKANIMEKDGLTGLFAIIKSHESVYELPTEYLAVLEWGRTSLASTLFQHYVASDASSENLAALKRIHGMMPYLLLKGVLKISDPVAMIRGVLNLFMAQPFGRSVLQRMFTSSLAEEVKEIQEEINAVEDKIDDPIICEKLQLFVKAPQAIRDVYHRDAENERFNILTCILRSPESPALNDAQMHRVRRAHRAHLEYLRHKSTLVDSDDDDGPLDDDGWLYEDLKILAKLYARLRDREELIALMFEGTTSEVLKDILTIFYSPLAQVYKAASIADSIGDVQNFVNDLIKTVEQVEELSQHDAAGTVHAFLDLVHRHQQAFYHFVHKVHTKGENLFNSLIRWVELFLTFIRDGPGEEISLDFILPHTGKERQDILTEVDAVALYHYKLKLAYEEKVRRRFGKFEDDDPTIIDDDLALSLVNGADHDQADGELIIGEANDFFAEDEEDSDFSTDSEDSEESEETESEKDLPPIPPPKSASMSPTHISLPFQERGSLRKSNSLSMVKAVHPHRSLTFDSALSTSRSPSTSHNLSPRRRQSVASAVETESRRNSPPKAGTISETPRTKFVKPGEPSYPDLKAIPQLVPLFIELMRPNLRPRAV